MPRFLDGPLAMHLPPLRLVSRTRDEYAGACPFCGGDLRTSDRFHVWLHPAHAGYWCRRCTRRGSLAHLRQALGEPVSLQHDPAGSARPDPARDDRPTPIAAHWPFYRRLYGIVATWADAQLWQPANPDPLHYLARRGLDHPTIRRARLGYALTDPTVLHDVIQRQHADLLPYAEAAGVLVRDRDGQIRTHWNLCGRLVFPYLANGMVVDLRTRRYPGSGYTSLPGSYAARGAVFLYGWDAIQSDVVLITEGEIKALAVNQAVQHGSLAITALAHPGLSYMRDTWPTDLIQRGIATVILGYDVQPRPCVDGQRTLAPEEIWTLRHGWTLRRAGLDVLVLRLPRDVAKTDLDTFLLQAGPHALTAVLQTVVPLCHYHRSLPPDLLRTAHLPVPHRQPAR